jgi:uncharacterized protein YciI
MMQRVRILVAGLILAALAMPSAFGQEKESQDEKSKAPANKRFWIILVTGKSAAGVAKEELQAMQKAHIDNFDRLARLGELFAAGPMADPQKHKRGIILVQAESEEKLPDLFAPDPYVKQGYMKLEASEIVKMDGTTKVDFEEKAMEELRIAVLDRAVGGADKSGAELKAADLAHEAYWSKWRAAKKVAIRCKFTESSPHFSILLFPKSDDAEIKKLLDGDPMVQTKMINYSLMPQYLMKGAVSVE